MVQAVQKFFADQERQGKVRRAPDQSYYLTETGVRPARTFPLSQEIFGQVRSKDTSQFPRKGAERVVGNTL